MTRTLTIVGIGAGGAEDLSARVRSLLAAASTVVGSPRQLEALGDLVPSDRHRLLPTPLVEGLPALLDSLDSAACLLASGDPTMHGIATTVARIAPDLVLRIEPHVSSVSLACARVGWAQQDVTVVSLVNAAPSTVLSHLSPGARVMVLARDASTLGQLAELLQSSGWGASSLTVCAHLGADNEQVQQLTVADARTATSESLVVIAIEAAVDGTSPAVARSSVPGLDDAAFITDGALTRQEIRALALALLEPAPGHRLWDIGAGSGSIAIEWLRAGRGSTAIAIEPRADRLATIAANAQALGTPQLEIVEGSAPDTLVGLAEPDAIFVGGGVTEPSLIMRCWDALPSGGRLVATAVTLESEETIRSAMRALGGRMVRLEASHLGELGSFTAWRPELPVSIWKVRKP